ncbi:MAG: oligosaccharide flippase family protein, partial [Clostridiales bacterium]
MSAKQQGLLLGTILMLFSNIIVKGLGFAYRVILVRLLGTEGVGLIEMVSPLFSFLLVFAGLGIQPALSQKVASTGDDKQIFMRTAQIMLLFSGILLTLAGFGATDFMIAH